MQTLSVHTPRKRFKADEVREILRCQEESGLSLFQYCKENTLPYKTLTGWRRRLGRQAPPKAATSMFVPVDVKREASSSHESRARSPSVPRFSAPLVEVRLRFGRGIRVRADVDAVSLQRLIE